MIFFMSYVDSHGWSTLMYAISSIEPYSQFYPPTFIFMKPCGLKIGCLQSKSKMSCIFLFLFLVSTEVWCHKTLFNFIKRKRVRLNNGFISIFHEYEIMRYFLTYHLGKTFLCRITISERIVMKYLEMCFMLN